MSSKYFLLFAIAAFPSFAWAEGGTVVLPPLVAKGVDAKLATSATDSLAFELDFAGAFDSVKQLTTAPSGYGASCLTSVSCLGGVAKNAGGDYVLAGSIGTGPSGLQVYLLLYDRAKNTIIRKNTYDLPMGVTAVADNASLMIKEMTGETPTAAAKPKEEVPVFTADDEDDDFEMAAPSGRIATTSNPRELEDEVDEEEAAAAAAAAKKKAEAEAKAKAEADAKAKAEAARIAAEAKAKADAEAKAKAKAKAEAEAEAARIAAEAKARASAPPPEEDFSSFELGAIVVDDEEEAEPPPVAAPKTTTRTSAPPPEEDDDLAFLEDDDDDFSLDEEPKSSTRSASSREEEPRSSARSTSSREEEPRSSARSTSSREEEPRSSARSNVEPPEVERNTGNSDAPGITLTPRIGYCRLPISGGDSADASLNFITYGPELAVPFSNSEHSVQLAVGIEGHSTQRHFTDEEVSAIAAAEGVDINDVDPNPWNSIVPINLGIQYKYAATGVRPYLGLDLILVPNPVDTSQIEGDTSGVDMAFGARGRAGVDFMISEGFGFNINLGIAYLGGSTLAMVDDALGNGALLPQVSGGTVFQF